MKWENEYKVAGARLVHEHLLSQFFPVPPTALGSVGGWPRSGFTDEDLMLRVTC